MRGFISSILLGASLACSSVSLYDQWEARRHPPISATWDQADGVVTFTGDPEILCEVIDEFYATRLHGKNAAAWRNYIAACKEQIREQNGIRVEAKDGYTFTQWRACLHTVMLRHGATPPCEKAMGR